MKKQLLTICMIHVLVLLGHTAKSQNSSNDNLNLYHRIGKIKDDNIFKTRDYFNWGGSIIKGEDNKYHLFYSRWKDNFYGWLTASEIAHAVSLTPSGPWKYEETVIMGRGKGHWDAITAHNPKIKYFNGKYYLYYISTNAGDMNYTRKMLLDTNGKSPQESQLRKLLRENQRTGVAISSSITGPWKRLNSPIIEPSGPITTLTVNPAIAKGEDGKYYLIVKGDKPNEKRFIRNQAIAISNSPKGPFIMQEKPVIDNQDTEDMSLWYDNNRKLFYGIFHAHSYLGLVVSADGKNWKKSQNEVVLKKNEVTKIGAPDQPQRMERPFIFVEKNSPTTLLTSVKTEKQSYILTIPIKPSTK
ncbi:glycoside hydrolase family protein [Halosquirtibacter xylanolyticus]|uniref:glycoside hydrolase family protein n=1 Tax=Halosquirtibacter xylanolyticus TaxID=3374599 RepID=UPI0037495D5D|nr:glycoside hydrolase family protein [Prolixibacteraceae bacterium]